MENYESTHEDYDLSIAAGRERERQEEPKRQSLPEDPFPEELKRRYYIVDDTDIRHVYADPQTKKELFRDTGDELRSKEPDKMTIRLMLDTAAHRGWNSIEIKGNKDFVREAWLEAKLRGIEVKGHEPSDLDIQELEKRSRSLERSKETAPAAESRAPGEAAATRKPAPERPNYKAGISGEVMHIGSRPYLDKGENEDCPYVDLRLDGGQFHRVWGVGLPDALERDNVKVGDKIQLRETGKEEVQKTIEKPGPDGEITSQTITTFRRGWEATVERELDRSEAADQAEIDRITNSAYGAYGSIHSGPGRDVAFEGTSANEDRAMDFATYGTAAAAATPELAGAVATARHIEVKLKQAFPDKPLRVEQGMLTAKAKIGTMIRSGIDFPKGQSAEQKKEEELEQDRDKEIEKTSERTLQDIPRETRERER